MTEEERWKYDEVVAKMRAEGFRPMVLIFARTRPDVHPDASEFSFHFPSALTQAEKDVTMETIKKALFEQVVHEQFEAAVAEDLLRRGRRHRDN